MKVCIEKNDQGQFFVSTETESMPEMAQEEHAAMPENKQPAKNLEEALMLAGRLLSKPAEGEQSMFDQGVAKTLPQRGAY